MDLYQRMQRGGYQGYSYAYPHKTAYRSLDPPVSLKPTWAKEDRQRLFLYVHLPFCEMRCGFCNLFTAVQAARTQVDLVLEAIMRQSKIVSDCLGSHRVIQAAIGGGTPSLLDEGQLRRLFDHLVNVWSLDFRRVQCSFEASPATLTSTKLDLLRYFGVHRLSLGVQSFHAADLADLGRAQSLHSIEQACQKVAEAKFPVFNIDLIYGNETQDESRWEYSLRQALTWQPQELFLYPLYLGQGCGLDKTGKAVSERRRRLYDLARQLLMAQGYQQVSMRLFRLPEASLSSDLLSSAPDSDFCCQQDATVGLGPGARSYTRALHYSSRYAVSQAGIRSIIDGFCQQQDFSQADYGFVLDAEEQLIRRVIKTLLRGQPLDFNPGLPQLQQLLDLGLAQGWPLQLTEEGLAWSDTIGPWLYSSAVKQAMEACVVC